MRYHHRHIGMVKVPNTDNLKYWGRDAKKEELKFMAGGNTK